MENSNVEIDSEPELILYDETPRSPPPSPRPDVSTVPTISTETNTDAVVTGVTGLQKEEKPSLGEVLAPHKETLDSSEPEKARESLEDTDEPRENEVPKRILASEVFCVSVNDVPFFYANNLGIAQRNLQRYLASFIRRQSETFRVRKVSEMEYHLTRDTFFFINYDRLEHVFTIHSIPKIGFVEESLP